MPILLTEELNIQPPEMIKTTQLFEKHKIDDIKNVVFKELHKDNICSLIKPGSKVAIAVGSRGISNLSEIVSHTVQFIKDMGAYPFITSAMGSHGGGTEKGQLEVLTGYNITEEKVGAPVIISLDTVHLGTTPSGFELFTDKLSYEADLTILINRIKPHTDFLGKIESGLCKMAVIGLGNHKGCSAIHKAGFHNFSEIIPEAAAMIFEKSNIGFGLALIENAVDETVSVEAIPSQDILKREPELLSQARGKMPRLYFPEIDILIVEEIGKNISGNGVDPNIVGRHGPKAFDPSIPKIPLMIVLDLSPETHGNAIGIGTADIITSAAFKKIDFTATYANSIASGDVKSAMIPLIMKDEKEALAVALKLYGKAPSECKIVRLKNTLSLEHIQISQALVSFAKNNPDKFKF